MIICGEFIRNLFIGVLIDNFNKIREQEDIGSIFITDSQKDWIEVQRLMLNKVLKVKQVIPTHRMRRFFYNLVHNKYFDYFITFCIFTNTAVMAIRYYQMNPTYASSQDICNYIFSFVFNCECIFKIIGLGKRYFYESWNRFDFVIVICIDIGRFMNLVNTNLNISNATTIVRGFRIMRVFRIVK